MAIGRNQICTCGSGRKYKHCCLNKLQTTQIQEQERHEDNSKSDDISSLRSAFQGLLFDMHDYKLKRLSHIKEYKKLRKLHIEIITSMANYFDQGKFSLEVDTSKGMESTIKTQKQQKSQNPDVFHLIEYDLETYEGVNAYYDSFIYKMASNVNSITEDFISSKRYRKPEKIKMLESMHNSVCGIFEIFNVDSEQGYVQLKNVFTDDVYKIIDISMSMENSMTDVYVYRRLITFDSITFAAGTPLTFDKHDPFILEFIKHHKKNWQPLGEFLRFNELYNHYTASENRVRVKRNELK